MEIIGWIFGLLSFVGGYWTATRDPRWWCRPLGALPPAVWVFAMYGVFVWSPQLDPLPPLFYATFFVMFPLASGILGLVSATLTETERFSRTIEIARRRLEVRKLELSRPEGPYR